MKRLPDDIEERMQFHLYFEEKSIRFYGHLASWLEYNGYFNTAKLYNSYATEEGSHKNKVKQYLLDRDVAPKTPAQEEITQDFKGLKDVLDAAYKFTVSVSDEYNKTAAMCIKSSCIPTFTFVQWFVSDQIKEEAKAKGFLDRISMLEENKAPLSDFEDYMEDYLEAIEEANKND